MCSCVDKHPVITYTQFPYKYRKKPILMNESATIIRHGADVSRLTARARRPSLTKFGRCAQNVHTDIEYG